MQGTTTWSALSKEELIKKRAILKIKFSENPSVATVTVFRAKDDLSSGLVSIEASKKPGTNSAKNKEAKNRSGTGK